MPKLDPAKVDEVRPAVAAILKKLPGLHPIIHDDDTGWRCLRHDDCNPLVTLRTALPRPPQQLEPRPEHLGGDPWTVPADTAADVLTALEGAQAYHSARDQAKAAEGGNAPAPSWLTTTITRAYNTLLGERPVNTEPAPVTTAQTAQTATQAAAPTTGTGKR